MKISIAQINPVVGDVSGNISRIEKAFTASNQLGGDLVVFPELCLSGYPPQDLLERPWFIEKIIAGIDTLRGITRKHPSLGLLIGAPLLSPAKVGKGICNSAILIADGEILFTQHKSLLPTYDVFDEARYFDPAETIDVIAFKNEILGITICEDAWNSPEFGFKRYYEFDPVSILASKGATLIVNLSASPFHIGKEMLRYKIMQHHAKRHGLPFVFVNQVGGNDELVFDGRSMVIDGAGRPMEVLPGFQEAVQAIDIRSHGASGSFTPIEPIRSVHDALVLGIQDYLRKCGFSKAVIGLSGGIDSAVTCCLAVRALGPGNVLGITMPGPFSSRGSINDSLILARNLGIECQTIPIHSVYDAYLKTLSAAFKGLDADATEENIQARIRGAILMAVSNKFGHIVLTTGNKSEIAIGYCTLYGDMSGGLAVISDVPKTMVYQLAQYINGADEIIPMETILKPPSAELRPNQTDQDSLPPYEILDQIVEHYLDEDLSCQQILDRGFDSETVRWVIRTIDRNEYKRKQAAPGLKVTSKAFGMGRRMPIAARFEI